MKFVRLTAPIGDHVWIALDKIVGFSVPGPGVRTTGTRSRITAGATVYEVRETPEQILEAIEKALEGRKG